jgi:mycothione reductase
MKHYDIVVIGGGGGMKIALSAASMGLKTALVEQDSVGGTCLNRGCIPSKMLIYPTELPELIRKSSRINVISDPNIRVDFPALIKRISETVDTMSSDQLSKIKNTPNLDFYPMHAKFIADRILKAGENKLAADKVFITTGAKPKIPNIPGLVETPFMTSREALRFSNLPKHMIVIGAGYISIELGSAYAAAGTDVEFIVRSSVLRQEDKDIAEIFSDVFSKTHLVHTGFVPVQVNHNANSFSVTCKSTSGRQRVLTGDALLVATGVLPCTNDLELQNTGINTNEKGFIQVNKFLQTDVEGVYALGDCVGNYLYRHTANYEADYLIRKVLQRRDDGPIDYGPVPHAVFSVPEIAGVGITEQQAIEQCKDYVVGKASYVDSNAGLARGYEYGFVKVLVEHHTRRILGAHILGDEASDMIHLFIAMMKKEGTLDDMLGMIFIHPALPEIARDAVRDAKTKFDNIVQ